jgi:hypothetical protein
MTLFDNSHQAQGPLTPAKRLRLAARICGGQATHSEVCAALGVNLRDEIEERRRLGLPVRTYRRKSRLVFSFDDPPITAYPANDCWYVAQ